MFGSRLRRCRAARQGGHPRRRLVPGRARAPHRQRRAVRRRLRQLRAGAAAARRSLAGPAAALSEHVALWPLGRVVGPGPSRRDELPRSDRQPARVRAGDLAPPAVRVRAGRARAPGQRRARSRPGPEPRGRRARATATARSSTPSSCPHDRRDRSVRVLITGASGFAGGWLWRACVAAGDAVIGSLAHAARSPPAPELARRSIFAIATAVERGRRRTVAPGGRLPPGGAELGRAFVGRAGADVGDNVAAPSTCSRRSAPRAPDAHRGLGQLLRGLRVTGRACRRREAAPLDPPNPYAVSKTAGDLLAAVYADAHGIGSRAAPVTTMPALGSGRSFFVSSLARQAAQARLAGASQLSAVTGNPATRRDFTDVRDVVRAYRLLAALRPSRARCRLQRLLGEIDLGRRAGQDDRPADGADRGRADRRSRAGARIRGDGPARRSRQLTAATGWTAQISHSNRRWPTRSSGGSGG